MNKLKIGIVGLGTMANQLAEAVLKSASMQLYALCTRNAVRLAEYACKWGVEKTYTQYEDMLADEALDAVVIVTPNYLHAEMAISALKAGKHVFCEKPPAVTAEDARLMMESAQKNGKLLMYGLVFRFSPKHAFIRDLRDRGLFGDFYYGKAGIVRRCGNPGGWFGVRKYAGGGPLIDIGSHIIDLAMDMMGNFEPVSVFARTFKHTQNLNRIQNHHAYQAADQAGLENDVEELAALLLNAANGACLSIEVSNTSHIQEDRLYMNLLGSKGGVEVDPEIRISTTMHDYLFDLTPVVNCSTFDYGQGIVDEIQHFADCILQKCECRVPPEAGYTLMRVIEGAYRSAKSGTLVMI